MDQASRIFVAVVSRPANFELISFLIFVCILLNRIFVCCFNMIQFALKLRSLMYDKPGDTSRNTVQHLELRLFLNLNCYLTAAKQNGSK